MIENSAAWNNNIKQLEIVISKDKGNLKKKLMVKKWAFL